MGGPENGNFLLLYAMKMSLRRGWVVLKSLKIPLRNIKMVLKLDSFMTYLLREHSYMTSDVFWEFLTYLPLVDICEGIPLLL